MYLSLATALPSVGLKQLRLTAALPWAKRRTVDTGFARVPKTVAYLEPGVVPNCWIPASKWWRGCLFFRYCTTAAFYIRCRCLTTSCGRVSGSCPRDACAPSKRGPSHGRGHRFEPCATHQYLIYRKNMGKGTHLFCSKMLNWFIHLQRQHDGKKLSQVPCL